MIKSPPIEFRINNVFRYSDKVVILKAINGNSLIFENGNGMFGSTKDTAQDLIVPWAIKPVQQGELDWLLQRYGLVPYDPYRFTSQHGSVLKVQWLKADIDDVENFLTLVFSIVDVALLATGDTYEPGGTLSVKLNDTAQWRFKPW